MCFENQQKGRGGFMKSKRIKSFIIIAMVICFLVFIKFVTSKGTDTGTNMEQTDFYEIKQNYEKEIAEVQKGKYANLNVKDLEIDLSDINILYQINIQKNVEYETNTHEENLALVKDAINNYYGESFDMSIVTANVFDKGGKENEVTELSFEELEKEIREGIFDADKYFLLFGDARAEGKKGFLQIDSSLSAIWFSKGTITATFPMYAYEIKKVYNLTIDTSGLEDKIKLLDGEMTIYEAIQFVEEYLNNELPYEKNPDFEYEVAEVRVLDVEGQDALGFCVRKKYNNISFDYIEGTTQGVYNSEFWDDRGQVCMIKTDEIDNMCGLGGDTYQVEVASEELQSVISVDGAFQAVSKQIGNNSVYDVYGMELVYQFTPETLSDGSEAVNTYTGRLNWKIIARNQNDNKDTWFYVDLVNGKVSHRFKEIYGEE